MLSNTSQIKQHKCSITLTNSNSTAKLKIMSCFNPEMIGPIHLIIKINNPTVGLVHTLPKNCIEITLHIFRLRNICTNVTFNIFHMHPNVSSVHLNVAVSHSSGDRIYDKSYASLNPSHLYPPNTATPIQKYASQVPVMITHSTIS